MSPGTGKILLPCSVLKQALQLPFSMETGGAAALSVEGDWPFIECRLCTLRALLKTVLAYFVLASQWCIHSITYITVHTLLSEKQKEERLGHGYKASKGQVW